MKLFTRISFLLISLVFFGAFAVLAYAWSTDFTPPIITINASCTSNCTGTVSVTITCADDVVDTIDSGCTITGITSGVGTIQFSGSTGSVINITANTTIAVNAKDGVGNTANKSQNITFTGPTVTPSFTPSPTLTPSPTPNLTIGPFTLQGGSTPCPAPLSITLNWNAPSPDLNPTGSYQVFREDLGLIATLPFNVHSHTDWSVVQSSSYRYKVVAVQPGYTSRSGFPNPNTGDPVWLTVATPTCSGPTPTFTPVPPTSTPTPTVGPTTPTMGPTTPTMGPTTPTPPPLGPFGFTVTKSCPAQSLDPNQVDYIITWGTSTNADSYWILKNNLRIFNPPSSAPHVYTDWNQPAGVPITYKMLAQSASGTTIPSTTPQIVVSDSCALPTPTPAPHNIKGTVFLDNNNSGVIDAGDTPFPGNVTISVTDASVGGPCSAPGVSLSNPYTSAQIDGTYWVCLSVPSGYLAVKPVPPNQSVWLTGSDKSNIDFLIVSAKPWWQNPGGDTRIDIGFTNNIPSSASVACGENYASTPTASSLTPGVIFSGANMHDFWQGFASKNPWNWAVGDNNYQDVYSPKGGFVPTSYNAMVDITRQNNITPSNRLPNVCGGSTLTCSLSNPSDGSLHIFQYNGNVTINSATFNDTNDYVFLINGDLRINGNISVVPGATATFSVSGNITVSPSVGGPYNDETTKHIQGFFSTDKSFIVEGNSNCGAGIADKRLNIAGSVIVNASRIGGSFTNNRDMCGNNASCPAFSVSSRPDFLLNAPAFLQRPSSLWQEVAP